MDAYTEEQFRAAVAAAHTYGGVARALGLVPGGSATRRVRRDIDRWGVDDDHVREYLRHRGRRTWTDDDLEAAVAASSTYREVRERLGLKGASSHTEVRVRIAELGLDDDHLRTDARAERTAAARLRRLDRADDGRPARAGVRAAPRSWSDDDLRAAVATSDSFHQIFAHLGLEVGGSQWQVVKERVDELGLDTSHFHPRSRGRPRMWTDDDLREAVASSASIAGVLRVIGVSGGAARRLIERRIGELGLDLSHMTGQAWSRGKKFPGRYARPLDEILVRGSTYRWTSHLKQRLIDEGLKEPRCEMCGRDEWNGTAIPLELDHINGLRDDNRIENLRLLCPNCHAQTDTYCGRNIGRYDALSEPA